MAEHESDREDLLAEATALVERIELLLAGYPQPAVAGFRANGCASLFFGADPVYQFNTRGELRRAYAGGLLYKAERGRLIGLERRRTADRVELVRHELDAAAQDRFLIAMHDHLEALRGELEPGHGEILGQVPVAGDVLPRLRAWLESLAERVPVADKPHAV